MPEPATAALEHAVSSVELPGLGLDLAGAGAIIATSVTGPVTEIRVTFGFPIAATGESLQAAGAG